MDRWLRRATPLALLALAGLAWFERCLPGGAALAERFGSDAVLRFVVGLLAVYTALLVVERQRMDTTFKQLLGAFKDYVGTGRKAPSGGKDPEREAIQILIGALESPEAEVRNSAAAHLHRLTGQDFGVEPRRWREWVAGNHVTKPSQK